MLVRYSGDEAMGATWRAVSTDFGLTRKKTGASLVAVHQQERVVLPEPWQT